ncbi:MULTISPECIES: hypothetical protein [unclassified Gemella]|uniref:DUF1659 domain-containing protein n=1 Tax=unclassified Gemella TaxID=2624949 RepID=UPI0010748B23|nr:MULTISPECIES: hypothetical protein [unclassified Gemella]MBF0710369.1 hypothetical protein [Gemella sp. GL1.1]MBF0747181.1 hypothetical protein [Gemella sp. 19428wG2_WT2a]NYS27713.1 hypothetical protein [Gemella sp. GL1]TFU58184.1 hypothetical protein E4T67_05900 [Gemella sp. WT2a]
MTVVKKELRLHYSVEKEGKEVKKSYSYQVAKELDKQKAREIADLMSPLFLEDIENVSVQTTELI